MPTSLVVAAGDDVLVFHPMDLFAFFAPPGVAAEVPQLNRHRASCGNLMQGRRGQDTA